MAFGYNRLVKCLQYIRYLICRGVESGRARIGGDPPPPNMKSGMTNVCFRPRQII